MIPCLSGDVLRLPSYGIYISQLVRFARCCISVSILIKKRLLLRCKHHFKSDIINDMDHMRISGTEPSSVILSQRK